MNADVVGFFLSSSSSWWFSVGTSTVVHEIFFGLVHESPNQKNKQTKMKLWRKGSVVSGMTGVIGNGINFYWNNFSIPVIGGEGEGGRRIDDFFFKKKCWHTHICLKRAYDNMMSQFRHTHLFVLAYHIIALPHNH